MARSSIYDGVDPRLVNLINQVSSGYKPYGVRSISGSRPGSSGYHGSNRALDVELFNRDTGAALENYQDPANFNAYQQFANAVYEAADPDLQKLLRWGGYFSGPAGKYGALDLMHFDLGGGETPMGGGSWAGGLTPDQASLWGLQTGGGVGSNQQFGPTMPSAPMDFTPEQRRAAIASIESAGSGDYGALGPVTNRQGDRAYGRYQVMGSNIPAWSKQVLGREITTDEFMRDPKIQDAIFDKIFGDYVQKYGERGAASMWFTGRPNEPDVKDMLGTTGKGYVDRYMSALGGPLKTGDPYPAQNQPAPAGGGGTAVAGAGGAPATEAPKDQMASGLQEMASGVGSMFGAGGGGNVASTPMVKPTATPTLAEAAQTFNPAAADAQRQKLAQALTRLNSGKLWVG